MANEEELNRDGLEMAALSLAGVASWEDLPVPLGGDSVRYMREMPIHYRAQAERAVKAYLGA